MGPTGSHASSVAAVLAYALLMQSEIRQAMAVLQPWLQHPDRHFWIQHFYADALRAEHRCMEAVLHYRQALADGSSFAGTSCQLLLALHRTCPTLALKEAQAWPWPLEAHRLEGMRQAAGLAAGLELAEWLQAIGLASGALGYRLACQRLYALQPMTAGGGGEALVALRRRLHRLGLDQLV